MHESRWSRWDGPPSSARTAAQALCGGLRAAAFRAPVLLFDIGAARLLGHRFLLLTHRGRRTGLVHRTVLEVIGWDPLRREATVLVGFGPRADWFRNLRRGGGLEVRAGDDRFVPVHRVLDVAEAAEALAGYERRNRMITPVLRAILSRLAGFDYDGTPEARLRLVGELPIVAVRPG